MSGGSRELENNVLCRWMFQWYLYNFVIAPKQSCDDLFKMVAVLLSC